MDYNFLHSRLLPKVTCSSPPMDNYEAENLINENEQIRSRGFLAYTSIKPPVDVNFELLCPIGMHYILIVTTVGTQKTTGVEILARSNNSDFISIAKTLLLNNETGIIACNSRMYSTSKPPSKYREDFQLCFFKSNTFRTFTNACELKVRIFRTEKSVPCLGKVEIWGKVSKMCSTVTVQTVNRLMQRQAVSEQKGELNPTGSASTDTSTSFEIPEEFKDALTFEIMAIPMTLPSGSTVDKTTLDKYVESEASHGRHPCDPFTGLKFTDSRKPVLNMWLKSRIDMFLIQNAGRTETFALKRTVGKTNKDSGETNERNKRLKTTDNECGPGNSDCNNKSLEEAIRRTVNCDDFIKFTGDESDDHTCDSATKVFCILCKDNDNLYLLPCKHLYCKKCLLVVCEEKETKCGDCKICFTKNDLKKFHFA